jgi:uncharacterized protein YjeT (DUF2065 family)
MVFVLEGLPYFAFPERFKTYLLKLTEVPDGTLRVAGLVSVVIGLILVYLGRWE